MIRIDRCQLRMPGRSEAEARELLRALAEILAERVAGVDGALLGRLDLCVRVSPGEGPRAVAEEIAEALLAAIDHGRTR